MNPLLTCAKCGRNSGSRYSFFYGRATRRSSSWRWTGTGKAHTTTTTYEVHGPRHCTLCHQCIRHWYLTRRLPWTCLGVVLMLTIAVILPSPLLRDSNLYSGIPPGFYTPLVYFASAILIICSIVLPYSRVSYLWKNETKQKELHDRLEVGEALAIHLCKKDLKRQGFNKFWTPKERAELSPG